MRYGAGQGWRNGICGLNVIVAFEELVAKAVTTRLVGWKLLIWGEAGTVRF
jgi:hypothetical protein